MHTIDVFLILSLNELYETISMRVTYDKERRDYVIIHGVFEVFGELKGLKILCYVTGGLLRTIAILPLGNVPRHRR